MNLAAEINHDPDRIRRFPVADVVHRDSFLDRYSLQTDEILLRHIFEWGGGILAKQKSQSARCIPVVVNFFVETGNRHQGVIRVAGMRCDQIHALIGADHFQVLFSRAFSFLFIV